MLLVKEISRLINFLLYGNRARSYPSVLHDLLSMTTLVLTFISLMKGIAVMLKCNKCVISWFNGIPVQILKYYHSPLVSAQKV